MKCSGHSKYITREREHIERLVYAPPSMLDRIAAYIQVYPLCDLGLGGGAVHTHLSMAERWIVLKGPVGASHQTDCVQVTCVHRWYGAALCVDYR